MIGTLISLAAALYFWLHPYTPQTSVSWDWVRSFVVIVTIPSLFLIPLAIMLAWQPLQKAGQQSTPQLLNLFRKDLHLKLATAYLLVFAFVTVILIPELKRNIIEHQWLLPVWIVGLGLAIDAIGHFVKRITGYLNPFVVVDLFKDKGEQAIQRDKELDLCEWLDGLAEIGLKGIQHHSTSLVHHSIDRQYILIQDFLRASKSLVHPSQDEQTKALGIADKVTFVLFYFYQRIDALYHKALKNRLEMSCTYILRIMGKVVVEAAKYDLSLASVPLRFIGKFAKNAQDEGFEETALNATCILTEVAKQLLTEIDITYMELQDPFLSIINGLEVLAKGEFKRNKSVNLSVLQQPFKDLKALFEEGKAKDHRDTPVIMQNINRVLGEFQALEMVMLTRPAIPPVPQEEGPK